MARKKTAAQIAAEKEKKKKKAAELRASIGGHGKDPK